MVWIIAKILKCLSTSVFYFLLTILINIIISGSFFVAGNLGTSEVNLCKSIFSFDKVYLFLFT